MGRERGGKGSKRFSWWKQITKRWYCLLTRIATIGVIALKRVRQRKVSDSGFSSFPSPGLCGSGTCSSECPAFVFPVTLPGIPDIHSPSIPSLPSHRAAVSVCASPKRGDPFLVMPECRCAHHSPRGIRQQRERSHRALPSVHAGACDPASMREDDPSWRQRRRQHLCPSRACRIPPLSLLLLVYTNASKEIPASKCFALLSPPALVAQHFPRDRLTVAKERG